MAWLPRARKPPPRKPARSLPHQPGFSQRSARTRPRKPWRLLSFTSLEHQRVDFPADTGKDDNRLLSGNQMGKWLESLVNLTSGVALAARARGQGRAAVERAGSRWRGASPEEELKHEDRIGKI